MPRCNGLEASRAIREEDPGASIILITASPDAPAARKALEMGYVQVAIPKPFYFEQLRMAMREAVGRPEAKPGPTTQEEGVA
jgi:DNA-binding NtrC family response regulator